MATATSSATFIMVVNAVWRSSAVVSTPLSTWSEMVQMHRLKPNPQSVNALLEQLGADKTETVYIGDSNVDVLTAKNGEVAFIGCSWGFRGEAEMREAGATIIAHSCKELQDLILGDTNE